MAEPIIQQLIQHLDDIQLDTNILMHKIQQDHLYSLFFSINYQVFVWSRLHFKIVRKHILNKFFLNILIENAKASCFAERIDKMYQRTQFF